MMNPMMASSFGCMLNLAPGKDSKWCASSAPAFTGVVDGLVNVRALAHNFDRQLGPCLGVEFRHQIADYFLDGARTPVNALRDFLIGQK